MYALVESANGAVSAVWVYNDMETINIMFRRLIKEYNDMGCENGLPDDEVADCLEKGAFFDADDTYSIQVQRVE